MGISQLLCLTEQTGSRVLIQAYRRRAGQKRKFCAVWDAAVQITASLISWMLDRNSRQCLTWLPLIPVHFEGSCPFWVTRGHVVSAASTVPFIIQVTASGSLRTASFHVCIFLCVLWCLFLFQTVSASDFGLHGVLIQVLDFTARWTSDQSAWVELESRVPAKLNLSLLDHTINLTCYCWQPLAKRWEYTPSQDSPTLDTHAIQSHI